MKRVYHGINPLTNEPVFVMATEANQMFLTDQEMATLILGETSPSDYNSRTEYTKNPMVDYDYQRLQKIAGPIGAEPKDHNNEVAFPPELEIEVPKEYVERSLDLGDFDPSVMTEQKDAGLQGD